MYLNEIIYTKYSILLNLKYSEKSEVLRNKNMKFKFTFNIIYIHKYLMMC